MSLDVTWLDSNSWLIAMGNQRILVDPWLRGDLVFGQQTWLFQGTHRHPPTIPNGIDLILLSQGLEDHAHPPTLALLDRSIPVVASPSAAQVVEKLGYRQVTTLDHGDRFTLNGAVAINAVPGAPVGPTRRENGYILRDIEGGAALFYEPHGFNCPELKQEAPVDVVITPVVDLALPLVGPIIRGQQGALERVEWLRPQVVLPTADAGDVAYSGLLLNWLKTVGTPESLRVAIEARGWKTQVLTPTLGQPTRLDLSPRQTQAAAQ